MISRYQNYTQPEDFHMYRLEKIQPAYAQFQGKNVCWHVTHGSRWMHQNDAILVIPTRYATHTRFHGVVVEWAVRVSIAVS